ncbi:DNA repair protein [Saccharobesus litoralis]|uniref:DNA repair protein n=1 Tax=Saccharobesus litoralis TaxID=2172099 RepID=A0A2S0VR35_9ALTE|nr:DNA repair ATPase [Saccharobesus litoralis]AWB66673.1 DNA repair protein [Saccharobesus litoralis]
MSEPNSIENLEESVLDSAVTQGGAYEVICARLNEQAQQLKNQVDALNQARIDEFGQAPLEVASRIRVRTENNCVARDIVRVGDLLLFGYNVFIGLKKETQVSDVFSLYKLSNADDSSSQQQKVDIQDVPIDGTFLADAKFQQEFQELYIYYKSSRLIQLKVQGEQLFAIFQIGRQVTDIRVFQWQINKDGTATYIDNRGERAIKKSASHDFEWQAVSREDHVSGKHPHISILDKVFVETVGGDLTIKVEDNTEDGQGIYREPVEDKTQSLADAQIHYAEVGSLILLKIQPYREKQIRYLVFNTRNNQVNRIDAIGSACISLPEDHGIIFPGGYYLQNGETKSFPDQIEGLAFKRAIRSPNGEDVLFVFYEPEEGLVGLFSYNLIRKELQNPIYGHGYCLYEDGQALIFSAEEEPTRVHPMQVWNTPYFSQEFAAKQPSKDTFYSRIGNKELVRGISELTSLHRMIQDPNPSRRLYEDLIANSKSLFDAFYWLDDEELAGIGNTVREISGNADLVIDEFVKVEQIRNQAQKALSEAEEKQQAIISSIRIPDWKLPEEYVACLNELRQQRGHLISLKEQRYINTTRLQQLDDEVAERYDEVSQATVTFLAGDKALAPYDTQISELKDKIEHVELVVELKPLNDKLAELSAGLDLLTEILNTLKVEDATVRTQILDDISEIYAQLNQVKALGRNRQKDLGSGEAVAEFAAQFRLFGQSINSALAMADTPEKADEQLSRLLVQLEELESKFSEYDQFLSDILTKREELHDAFESRKQTLLEERQRRAQNLQSAAERIISGVNRRASSFQDTDQLNTYFASDPMVLKLGELTQQLRDLDDQVKADDIEAKVKAAKEQAIRSLRDKQDIFEDGGSVIKLGKHKFSVNSQVLDLTLLPREGKMVKHLTGTDYFEAVNEPEITELKPYWQQNLVSENDKVCRAEYLAYQIIQDAEQQVHGYCLKDLYGWVAEQDKLVDVVRKFIAPRYQEGYEKGIHDNDAVKILSALLPIHQQAGLLRFNADCRALAALFLQFDAQVQAKQTIWQRHAQSAALLAESLGSRQGFEQLISELNSALQAFSLAFGLADDSSLNKKLCLDAANYLSLELAKPELNLEQSQAGQQLANQFVEYLQQIGHHKDYVTAMTQFAELIEQTRLKSKKVQTTANSISGLKEQWQLCLSWLSAFVTKQATSETEGSAASQHYLTEAAAILICQSLPRTVTQVQLDAQVQGLLSDHKRVESGTLALTLDEFSQRLAEFSLQDVANFNRYHELRHELVERYRSELQLEAFKANPLSSFVRNKLINDVYLHIIGDNLAKQMGTVGDNKRTDLMGLLLLISPPGYGKTTLMEYVANRLGLVFMKINCPSLGHDVTSLDPNQAPNATAAQELEKLNLGLEMGSNVMLYLDDIQHTHPEFLQKFISLCDGTRRIEGIWQGQSKTYDMRGKKFCVCMAGNPYTESGDVFKVPDMLANRADIYNLGDVLGGKEKQFALSYIENSLTSNPVLAPLALRDMDDVYKFVDMAQGAEIASTDLSHDYSGAEVNEIVSVLKHMLAIQEVILKVNLQYIESAATAEEYRTEPPFKLQGSYRNMNKMAEKVSSVMNHDELMRLIGDHYVGEAQTLTSGAEENLLKLAQLRGQMSETEQERWQLICSRYNRKQALGDESDPKQQMANQLAAVAQTLGDIQKNLSGNGTDLVEPINEIGKAMRALGRAWMGSPKADK